MSGTVTGLDLDRLEELAEKATPGPWRSYPMDDVAGCSVYDSRWLLATVAWYDHNRPLSNMPGATGPGYIDSDANAAFIAEFRNAVPSLLAAARAVQRVEAALDLLASDTPGEMLVLPPEHYACEREVTRLVVVALRAALGTEQEGQQ